MKLVSRCTQPSGNPLYIANEDDNIVTVVDVKSKRVLAEERSLYSFWSRSSCSVLSIGASRISKSGPRPTTTRPDPPMLRSFSVPPTPISE